MIQQIDELVCIDCGLCDDVCPTDVFRRVDEKIQIVYPNDCSNCMECFFICPTEAIILAPGIPPKFNLNARWEQVKKELSTEKI